MNMDTNNVTDGVGADRVGELSSRSLPSLFGLCNSPVSTMAGKDLDGLIALNDSALSQQIEFILQDATMEQEDETQELMQQNLRQHNEVRIAKETVSVDYDSNSQATSMSPTTAIKLETPPTSTTPITSASELSQTGLEAEFTHIDSPQSQQQQPQHQHHNHHLLNGRRIIVRSSDMNELTAMNISAAQQLIHQAEVEDPELNDENLQDIEEEAKAAEADEEPVQLHSAQIKLEDSEMVDEVLADGNAMDYIKGRAINNQTATAQLVFPAGSIVSTGGTTSTRSITVPVSEALAQLQRRPVYISNAIGNIGNMQGTLVRMPAVISRNGSMAVLNVVQQGGSGVGGTTTQLILQATPVAANGTSTVATAPMMVAASSQTNKLTATGISPSSSPTSNASPMMVTSTPTNTKNIINGSTSFNRIVANTATTLAVAAQSNANPSMSAAISQHIPPNNSTNNLMTNGQHLDTHPIASTSAAALANLNALHSNNTSTSAASYSNISSVTSSTTSSSTSSASVNTATTSSQPISSGNAAGAAVYQCVDCVEKFDSKDLFDIHRSGHANNMKCAICNMVLKSLKNYEKHCLRCKPYECQICGRVVRFRPNFIKHMRVHTGQQSERHKYKCEVCHKEFMSFEYFKVHKKIHNENVNLTCEICGKVFSALASLRGHSKLHSGVKLHKCDVCGKGFGQRYNLKIHARTHTGDFPFECKICKKKLHTQSSLQNHMQVHQRDNPTQQSVSSSSTTATTIRYQTSNTNNSTDTSTSSGGTSAQNSPTSSTVHKVEHHSTSKLRSHSGRSVLQNPQSLMELDIKHDGHGGGNIDDGRDNNNRDDDDDDDNSTMSDGHSLAQQFLTTPNVGRNVVDDSLSESSSNSSNEQQKLQQEQPHLMLGTPTRTIVINNYMQTDQDGHQQQQHQQNHAQVIRQNSSNSSNSALQQQLMRKTPIIHSTNGVSSCTTLSSSVVQHIGTPPSPKIAVASSSSTVLVNKLGSVPLSLASAAAFGSSTIIRSTHNSQQHQQQQQQPINLNNSNNSNNQNQTQNHQRSYQRNNHRNHHRRRHLADLDDDDDDDDHINEHRVNLHRSHKGRNFDDDDDVVVDEKTSPSLALTAIKVEPNLYSSGDNSNEMLIKEEAIFDDSPTPNSPQSPPSSRYRMSNFEHDLEHHVDLSHSLPTYGYLLDHHSIPDGIPSQLYADDDDFKLDHSSLTGLNNSTSSITTDGDYIKKEWSYGTDSAYTMNGKFDEDSDVLCDAANFMYN
uniref:C2H2-type domain-containing protein n=1 Tax=Glossina austeni TaxID=7395 RepID=A0A1A9UT22_GLOAU